MLISQRIPNGKHGAFSCVRFTVNFNIRNKDVFNRYINDYIDSEFFDLDSEKEQVSDFSELVDNILRTVTYCQNNITSHLIVGDIKVMDVVH